MGGPLHGVKVDRDREHRARARSRRCCSPTSAPTWSGSTARAGRGNRSARGRGTACIAGGASVGGRPEARRRAASWCSRLCRVRRRAHRGLPAGRDGAARPRSGRLLAERNPRLVYGRMTGYGQDGPMAAVAGHDINYIAIAGVLGAIGAPGERPLVPLNLVGDFGGGGMLLALGVVCAAARGARGRRRARSSTPRWSTAPALLATMIHGMRARGHVDRRAGHEPARLRRALLRGLRDARRRARRGRRDRAAVLRELLRLLEPATPTRSRSGTSRAGPSSRTRFAEVFRHAHARRVGGAPRGRGGVRDRRCWRCTRRRSTRTTSRAARFVEVDGKLQPAPAPRFSRTPGAISRPPAEPGADTDAVLRDWGIDDVAALRAAGAVSGPA